MCVALWQKIWKEFGSCQGIEIGGFQPPLNAINSFPEIFQNLILSNSANTIGMVASVECFVSCVVSTCHCVILHFHSKAYPANMPNLNFLQYISLMAYVRTTVQETQLVILLLVLLKHNKLLPAVFDRNLRL